MMTQSSAERRRYFRVNDTLDISCRLLRPEEVGQHASSGQQVSRERWLGIENDIQIAVEKVRQQSSELAELMALFNQKINLIGFRGEGAADQERGYQHSAPVNISACGIAFCLPKHFPVGASLQLKLRLYPNMLELSLPAVVIACESRAESEDDSDAFNLVRADFAKIEDEMQEILIQHILKCQTRELKQRRQYRQSE